MNIELSIAKARRNLKAGKSPLKGLTSAQIKAAQTQFSDFKDKRDKRGFIVQSAHSIHCLETPRPYLHLMASLHPRGRGIYGSFWDQTGRGFSCLDSVLAGPVTSHNDTSYVPTCPTADDYRAFYVHEKNQRGLFRDAKGRAADVWFLLPQPGRDPGRSRGYNCLQGAGETTIAAESRGIAGSLHCFVTRDDPVEIWTIRLKNTTNRARKLTLFSRINWGLRSYPAYYFDMRVVCNGIFDRKLNAIAAFNNDQNNKLPRSGVMMSDVRVSGYDLSREVFDGDGIFREFPEAVVAGACRNSLGRAPYAGMVGVIQQEIRLAPHAEQVIHTLLGAASRDHVEAAKQRAAWRRKYLSRGVERALAKVRGTWAERCGRNLIRTGDDEVDRFFNIWSKYQASNQARFTRALDMTGYRDVLQDIMGICDFDPAYVRQELLTALSYQLSDGRAIRQYCKFKGAAHDLRMYMDSPVWIPDTLVTYVKETGDFGILKEKVGFFDMATKAVDTGRPKTVYEHAMLAITSCFERRGQKGLCLVGHGDWNDALDGIGRGGRGVSTWLTLAVIYAADLLASLAQRIGRTSDTKYLRNICSTLTRAVNKGAWDGSHYIYGFNDRGVPIGSLRNEQGKIHLNVNSWAILAGVASAGGADRVKATLKAIEKLNTPLGHLLLAPSYSARSRWVGRIADMLPGLFENGALYTHGQSFVSAAMLSLGMGDDAWEAMKDTMPSRTLPAISTMAPHQQSNFTVGIENADYGKNYYSNFTGSLNWYRKNLIRTCGVVADYDGLRIDPCVPGWLRTFEVSKIFRCCRYHVKVSNPEGVCSGVRSILVDGKPLAGNLVPSLGSGSCHVEVVMGRKRR